MMWLLVILVVAILTIGLAGGRFNRTASLPIGLYWIIDKEPNIGDYVQFCAPVKQSALPPIDTVYVIPCTKDHEGIPLLKRVSAIDRAAGLYYVEGDHPKSLDSRVFGPITRRDIKATLRAAWVFERS